MDVLILAGGKCDADLAAATGQSEKWAVECGGASFLQTALDAVSGVGDVVVVGGPPNAPGRVEGGRHFIESLANGLGQVKSDRFLLVTADLPFVTAVHVARFLDACPATAGICYPIVPMPLCLATYPTLARTSLKLREGEFTGGNLAVFRTEDARRFLPILERGYAARKSPVKLGRIVGMGMLFSVLFGKLAPRTLSLPKLEARVGKFLGTEVRAVIVDDPAIGTDIDTAAQFQALLALKANESAPTTTV